VCNKCNSIEEKEEGERELKIPVQLWHNNVN
jgi:hypothetical protein